MRQIIKTLLREMVETPFPNSQVKEPVYHFNHKDHINPHMKSKRGIFFTNDPSFGQKYFGKDGVHVHRAYIDLQNPFITTPENLAKVFTAPLANQSGENWLEERIDDFINANAYERQLVWNYAQVKGHDGLILPEDWDGGWGTIKSFVVFSETQIHLLDSSKILQEANNDIYTQLKQDHRKTLPKIWCKEVFLNPVKDFYHLPTALRSKPYHHLHDDTYLQLPVEEVDVRHIIPTQRFLSYDNLLEVKNIPHQTGAYLFEVEGMYYVLDGHHRVATRILQGDPSVAAHVYHAL